MSMDQIDELHFEFTFPSVGDYNETHEITFTLDGIEVEYETIPWEKVHAAYRALFGLDINKVDKP